MQKVEDTEGQTTLMDVSALPSFDYPLYMDPEGNQSQQLYSVHTLQKRQIQPDVPQGTSNASTSNLASTSSTASHLCDKSRDRLRISCKSTFVRLT